MKLIALAEKRLLPDRMIRAGIRKLLRRRLADEQADNPDVANTRKKNLLAELRNSPIAIATDAANEQHYEVPAEFYQLALGRHVKYSGCWWGEQTRTLEQAEQAMLELYLERGRFADGQEVLELGCGWGSLALFLAQRFPASTITAVSNSRSQREYIVQQAGLRRLDNIRVITQDVSTLEPGGRYDRVASIEMFEHMRNYQRLLEKISAWLRPDGRLFVHIFCHKLVLYPFRAEGSDNWMGRWFFTGGLMPSADTLCHFQDNLAVENRWLVNGCHYRKTAEAWLQNIDRHGAEIKQLFEKTYGAGQGATWVQRWRMFFMACAELFGFNSGNEWMVAHYLFKKRPDG